MNNENNYRAKIKFGTVFMLAALITASINGFKPSYMTELWLWSACFFHSVYD
jgi:hypothetical protein